MGTFPLVSESHITNKIAKISRFSPILLCGELNENEQYLKRLKKTKIIAFRKNKDKNKKNIKSHLKEIAKKSGLIKLLKFTELCSPEPIIRLTLIAFKTISEINILFHNKRSKMYFFFDMIKKENIQVINGCYGWEIIPLAILKRKSGIKVILSIRGKDLAIIKKYRCIREITKNNADLLLTRSEYMRKELISMGFSKVLVNHSGCDVNLFTPDKNHKINLEKIRLVVVGRLVEKKGHIYLLEACKKLKEKKKDFLLTIIGDGPLRDNLEHFVKDNNLENNIKLIGEVSNDNIPEILRKNDIFVLPSIVTSNQDAEGIPVSLMEAMASGLVCISTRSIGIPELIDDGKNGFLVNERDSQDLADKIIEITKKKQSEIEQIRIKARDKTMKEFNSKTQSQRFESILSRSLKK